MFHKKRYQHPSGKQKKTETAAGFLQECCGRLTDYLICIHILIIVVLLPFYFKEGYGYIATDKNLFFREVCINMGKALAPVLTVYLVLSVIVYFQEKGKHKSRAQNDLAKTEIWKEIFRDGKDIVRRNFSIVDLFAGLYGLALVLSYGFSDYGEHAKWGSEGWYMGFYPQIMLLCTYFLIAKLWKPRKKYFYLILAVSAAVFGLGYLNRFGIYPIKMEMSSPGFISTIGNINWYCGYAVTIFFAGAAFLWQGGGGMRWQNVLLMLYVWLGFATLVTQGSASGIMTLVIVMFLLFLLSAGEGERMCRFWMTAFLLGMACVFTQVWMIVAPGKMNFPDPVMNLFVTGCLPIIMTIVSLAVWQWLCFGIKRPADRSCLKKQPLSIKGKYPQKLFQTAAGILVTVVSAAFLAFVVMITINTLYPGSIGKLSEYSIFTFSDTWGSRRGATWKAGIRCFAEQNLLHKLVGVGPDAMEAYIYQDGSRELVESLREVFGHNYLTNVHNEWLTVLVNTGLLGLAGFGGMMVSAMRSFWKNMGESFLVGACGISLFAYTVNNIFSFQQIMNVTSAYVMLGMGMAFLRDKRKRD